MQILFFLRHPGYVRNFESTLVALAERGHRIHVAFDRVRQIDSASPDQIERLGRESGGRISHSSMPKRSGGAQERFANGLRMVIDYLRYLEPAYADSPALAARGARGVPRPIVVVAEGVLRRVQPLRRLTSRALRRLNALLPVPRSIYAAIEEHKPDVILVSPLVDLGSPQTDVVTAARRRRIPVGLLVASWDNLTNKGLIKNPPDLVAVWNEFQVREAVEMHGVPPERVVATGAEAYDHWFGWSPSRTRAELCELVGLRTDRPLLLYLGSSSFIAPQEADFIQEWLAQLRAAGSAELAEAGVIVRPHPQNPPRHADGSPLDLSGAVNAVVWPPAGANPTSDQRKRDYFDSIHHSAAVIGINTSGLIESSIVGRRVYTLLADQFRDTQEGTLHFRYLVRAGGGMLVVANSFREHLEQLADAVARETPEDMRAGFLEAFIRPHGLDEPATPRLVAAVESLAAARPGAGQPVAAAPSRDEAAESPAGEAEAGISTIQVGNISTG